MPDKPLADPIGRKKLPTLKSWPKQILKKWPAADLQSLLDDLGQFDIDHAVGKSRVLDGGAQLAGKRARNFLAEGLADYGDLRNEPTKEVTSGLSPYLHFGHISAHEVFQIIVEQEEWSEGDVAEKALGQSRGWWGARECVESFLDELITWRELGYNMCWQREDDTEFESLPAWAQKTLKEHTKDRREYLYTLEEFENATTHDHLWNAA